jgi:hypothetical protein
MRFNINENIVFIFPWEWKEKNPRPQTLLLFPLEASKANSTIAKSFLIELFIKEGISSSRL